MIPWIFILTAVAFMGIGNSTGDQATMRDCATKGEAKMFGGGTIKCEVVKESK